MLFYNAAYCVKSSGEDLSRYSNEIEPVDLRKFQYCRYLTKKVTSQQQTFRRACCTVAHHGGKTAGMDMKKLRHCHPTY